MSMQQHGSDAAIGAIIGIHAGRNNAPAHTQRWLAASTAGPLAEGQESPDDDADTFAYEPHPAAAGRVRRWPASSAEAAGGRAFQVRASFEEELQRELSREGQQLKAESASRQMSMQQHGSDAAIGAIIGIHAGGNNAASASRLSGPNISTGIAGDTGGSSTTSSAQQQQQQQQQQQRHAMLGTSVQLVPGVGVVPADREDGAAAAATLGMPVRSRSSGALSSRGASSGNVAALAPPAAGDGDAAAVAGTVADAAAVAGTVADPLEPEAAVADDAIADEHSSTSRASAAAAGIAVGTGSANEQQQGSPQAGLVKGLWDTALMSYLQRDTALLEGITGGTHHLPVDV
jgi:hypothetical protein